jgi:hypothetical protein
MTINIMISLSAILHSFTSKCNTYMKSSKVIRTIIPSMPLKDSTQTKVAKQPVGTLLSLL